jgi:hypothetical protein
MSWVWWAIGTFGVAGSLLIVAVLIFGWPVIVGTKLGRTLLLIGTAGLGVIAIYAKGRSAGRAAERAQLKAKISREVADAKKEKARIDALTDEQVDAELAKWDRKS